MHRSLDRRAASRHHPLVGLSGKAASTSLESPPDLGRPHDVRSLPDLSVQPLPGLFDEIWRHVTLGNVLKAGRPNRGRITDPPTPFDHVGAAGGVGVAWATWGAAIP